MICTPKSGLEIKNIRSPFWGIFFQKGTDHAQPYQIPAKATA